MNIPVFIRRTMVIALGISWLHIPSGALGQQPNRPPVKSWDLPSATEQLRYYPKDPYLQYVYWQLSRREGSSHEAETLLRQLQVQPQFGNRTQGIDLFSIFSGALAVQESLQLDALANGRETQSDITRVPISGLTGPTVKSHPWKEMLGARNPTVGLLPKSVPEDFLFVRFDSLSYLTRVLSLSDQFGSYAVNQVTQDARTQALPARLMKQLAFELSPDAITHLDPTIQDIAIVSSDVFFSEGTDVSVLLELKDREAFLRQVDSSRQSFVSAVQSVERTQGELLGVPYVQWSNADRTIHAIEAEPKPNLYIRSNSVVALGRILSAIQGKDKNGKPAPNLGDSDEFKYIRTLMPQGAPEENGWIYMSDPFIRRMVGPQIKLTQKHRVTCYNHLRMIGHASLLHATEHGRLGASLEELKLSKCLPKEFGDSRMVCPDGGRYSVSSEGGIARCSHHGTPHAMIPCCESLVEQISPTEAQEYRQFLEQYNQYWRTFFDPIAIRIQLEPKRIRVETIILPLIDNSIYSAMANALGGKPRPMDGLPVPKRNIFTLAVQLDKAKLLKMTGMSDLIAQKEGPASTSNGMMPPSRWGNLQQAALGIMNFESAQRRLPPVTSPNFSSGLSWRVQILPMIGLDELYQKFHLDEPWDSPHNLKLVEEMPSVYYSLLDALNEQGKTTVVMPRHSQAVRSDRPRRLSEITDGTSNTILLIDADPEHAVLWTKPDDLDIDMDHPRQGWTGSRYGSSAIAFADAHLELLPSHCDESIVRALLTIGGGESDAAFSNRQPVRPTYERPGQFQLDSMYRKLLAKMISGLGDQVSLNLYDSDPLFDFNAAQFLGMFFRFNRLDSLQFMNSEGLIALLVLSLNSPVYVAAEVQDPAAVDGSLDQLDELLATIARMNTGGRNPFFSIEQDYYRFPGTQETSMRAYSFRFGPVKWRLYWGRIGNGLYLASKPYILEDLMAFESSQQDKPDPDTEYQHDHGPSAHAMVRIRPDHWREVLPQYRLAWAENQRSGCFNNIGILSSLSRTVQLSKVEPTEGQSIADRVASLETQLLDSNSYCPAGGEYRFEAGSPHVECSVHGTAMTPKQPTALAEDTPLGSFLNHLHDLHMELTFLEEGLQAVAVMELD